MTGGGGEEELIIWPKIAQPFEQRGTVVKFDHQLLTFSAIQIITSDAQVLRWTAKHGAQVVRTGGKFDLQQLEST